jgi:GAF domain-containing protein
MQTKSLLLISQESSLAKEWQPHFPETQIQQRPLSELKACPSPVAVLDCSTLAYKDCEMALENLESRHIFALVLEPQLADYGALFLRESVSILPNPLNYFGIHQIQQALEETKELYPSEHDGKPITYSNITREFATYAQDPAKLLQTMADTVRVTMNADWVAFVRVELHEDSNPSIENLAVSQGNTDKKKHNIYDIVRPDGHTMHIIKLKNLVVIQDTETFTLDGVSVNPQTLAWGFRAAVGLPLMRDNSAFGVMWVMYRQPRKFSHQDLHYMQVYASHAALAYSYPLQKKLAEQWQKAAQSIFARLSSAESLEAGFQHITDGIHESLECDVVAFYPYEQKLQYLAPPYIKGATSPESIHDIDRVSIDSLPYQILEERDVVVIENVKKDERFGKTSFAQREKINSLVALPLHRGSQKVGVVFINYRKRRSFNSDELQAIKILGEQIASSILNTYLAGEQRRSAAEADTFLAQMEKYRRQLSFMMHFIETEVNLNKQDLNEVLKSIAHKAYEIADADRVTIRVVDDNAISTLAIYPDDEEEYSEEERMIRIDGHSRYILERNEAVIIEDVKDYEPEKYDNIPLNPMVSERWKARIGLPMTSGEKSIGVMWVSFRKPHSLEHSRFQMLQTFAAMAYFTLKFHIEQEWLRRFLGSLTDAHNSITADMDEDAILLTAMEFAKRVISRRTNRLYRSHIARVEKTHIIFYPAHNDPEVYALLKRKLPPDASAFLLPTVSCIVAQVAQTGKSVLVFDPKDKSHFLPLLHDGYEGSQVSVPIVVGQRLYAVLSVEHPESYSFEWYDKAALEAIASYVGLVLHNREQEQERLAYVEAQKAQRDSLLELTHAAMYQFVKGHDMDNFRGLYGSTLPQALEFAAQLKSHQDLITKPIRDSKILDDVTDAIEGLESLMTDLIEIYNDLIEKHPIAPELTERSELYIRDWLWNSFHKDPEIHLHLANSLTDAQVCTMPAYWLHEVLKILVDNAKRAARKVKTVIPSSTKERLVRMEVGFCKGDGEGVVEISVINQGKPVPDAYKDYLIKRVIPRKLREEYGGNRGIGLFMSGIILEAYEGSLRYEPQPDETRFVLRLPAKRH